MSSALILLFACQGTIGGQGDAVDEVEPLCEDCGRREGPPVETRFPRLTHQEWENTVRDLFHLAEPPGLARDFRPDAVPNEGELSTAFRRLVVSDALWQDYQRAAESLAAHVTQDTQRARWLPAIPNTAAERDAFILSFGRRAFRRPLKAHERERYAGLYAEASSRYRDAGTLAGVRMVIETMLQSPHFLYRVDLSEVVDADLELIPITPFALASRLSYMFWGTMPDDELLDAASAGFDEEQIEAQTRRLLDDPRAERRLWEFHTEQFGLADWEDTNNSQTQFPRWSPDVPSSMMVEIRALFEDAFRQNGNIAEVLTSREALLDPALAQIYGLEFDETSRRMELPGERAGLLSRVGFLARFAHGGQPDPILRGLFVNRNILCRELPPPPDNIVVTESEGETNRDRVESLTHQPACRACHEAVINPPGFALEGFDAIGATRELDNGHPVDAETTFAFADGTRVTVDGAAELSEALASHPDSHHCYAKRLLEFLAGRVASEADRILIEEVSGQHLGAFPSIRHVALEYARSQTFRYRRMEPE